MGNLDLTGGERPMAYFAARVTRTRSSGVAAPGAAGHPFDAIRVDRAAARRETETAPFIYFGRVQAGGMNVATGDNDR